MLRFDLPYGNETLPLELEDGRVQGVLCSQLDTYIPEKTPSEMIEAALADPIGSATLEQLSIGKKRVTIIASDHTRPVPSKLLIPPMLRQIRKGNPDAQITILIATGCHRNTTREELIAKFGDQIVRNEQIVIHDCDDRENLCLLGTLPSGGECWVNRLAVESDLLVSEGFIEPHFFAGFSGGRKSVLPGIAGRESVLANHCAEFIAHPAARAGSLEGNPIHRDMVWAAEKAGLAFILNVVLNGKKDVVYSAAGDFREAHRAGCEFLDSRCGVKAAPADIVITTNGGYPLDQNIYQAVKGMTAAEASVRDGGVIIMLAQSGDGHGGDAFCREMTAGNHMDALMTGILKRERNETLPDQWQAQIFIRVLQKARVIYISDAADDLVESLHMLPAHSLPQALDIAEKLSGDPCPTVTVIPDGVGVIVHP